MSPPVYGNIQVLEQKFQLTKNREGILPEWGECAIGKARLEYSPINFLHCTDHNITGPITDMQYKWIG